VRIASRPCTTRPSRMAVQAAASFSSRARRTTHNSAALPEALAIWWVDVHSPPGPTGESCLSSPTWMTVAPASAATSRRSA
jgi:hypothetical protein